MTTEWNISGWLTGIKRRKNRLLSSMSTHSIESNSTETNSNKDELINRIANLNINDQTRDVNNNEATNDVTPKKEAVLTDDKSKPVAKLRAPIIDRQVIKKMIIDNMTIEPPKPKKFTKLLEFLNKSKQTDYVLDCCDSSGSSLVSFASATTVSVEVKTSNLCKSESINVLNDRKVQTKQMNIHGPSLELTEFIDEKAIEWNEYSHNLIDSHCHFDMLFSKIRYEKSLEEYFNDFGSIYLKNIEFCINIICHPYKYSSKQVLNSTLKKYQHAKVHSTLGCHPHFADIWTDNFEKVMIQALKNPDNKIVAIGECGLDSSMKNNVNKKEQIKTFKAQLRIAKETDLPIVIHCRNNDLEVYHLLTEFLNESHRIHLHCFTGGWKIAKKYLESFVNLCIGVTPLAAHCDQVKEVIINIPLDRLLIETDAPYFFPHQFPFKGNVSHPAFIFHTAECVASLRDITIDEVINFNRANVKRVYSI